MINTDIETLLQELHLQLEESRHRYILQYSSSLDIVSCHLDLEQINSCLQSFTQNLPISFSCCSYPFNDNIHISMIQNCFIKAQTYAESLLIRISTKRCFDGSFRDTLLDGDLSYQASIARIVELTLRISMTPIPMLLLHKKRRHIRYRLLYNEYQRKLLRQRSKESITNLENMRNNANRLNITMVDVHRKYGNINNNDIDEEEYSLKEEKIKWESQLYVQAMTVILGEASCLIHPLVVWKNSLHRSNYKEEEKIGTLQYILDELTISTIDIIHKEAEVLCGTVVKWILQDYDGIETEAEIDLEDMEDVVEELSFVCQVIQRYMTFITNTHYKDDSNKNIAKPYTSLQIHLQELSLHYSTAESVFLTSQFQRSVRLACPIEIVVHTQRYIPSILEDVVDICFHSLERANSTLCSTAIEIVVHWVCDIWNPQSVCENHSIYAALIQYRGCTVTNFTNDKGEYNAMITSSSTNNFKDALLQSIDNDVEYNTLTNSSNPTTVLERKPLRTLLCFLNGIQSASFSCQSLSNILHSNFIGKVNRMASNVNTHIFNQKFQQKLQFFHNELLSYSTEYLSFLRAQIHLILSYHCGSLPDPTLSPSIFESFANALPFHRLHWYISQQNYNIDKCRFDYINVKEQIESDWLNSLLNSPFVEDVKCGKSDKEITLLVAKEISHRVSTIILTTILHRKPSFTDWGSLLLSKQVRIIQDCLLALIFHEDINKDTCNILAQGNTSVILEPFHKLSQAIAILQLDKPSDWSVFQYNIGANDSISNSLSELTNEETKTIMSLRVDFSFEAIHNTCGM